MVSFRIQMRGGEECQTPNDPFDKMNGRSFDIFQHHHHRRRRCRVVVKSTLTGFRVTSPSTDHFLTRSVLHAHSWDNQRRRERKTRIEGVGHVWRQKLGFKISNHMRYTAELTMIMMKNALQHLAGVLQCESP